MSMAGKDVPKEVGIGLLGYGTVGSSVYQILKERADEFEKRFDQRYSVKKVLVRNIEKRRDIELSERVLTVDIDDVLGDPDIHVIIEVMGGVDPTFEYLSRALRTGRPVVTANKHLLAEKGEELEYIALEQGVPLRYDASVGGIIPVFSTLGGGVHAMDVTMIQGVLNGTTNYILSCMYNEGASYEDALKDAQLKGYAEPDPSMDLSGMDTAHKLCVLSRLVFGKFLPLKDVEVHGIGPQTEDRLVKAKHRGKKLKLVGSLDMRDLKEGDLPVGCVMLEEIGQKDRLYIYDGTENCILLDTKDTGMIIICGRGAGGPETATAVISDLLSIQVQDAGPAVSEEDG